MSPIANGSTTTDENEEGMEIDGESRPPSIVPESPFLGRNRSSLAVVLRDSTNWLPHVRALQETDVIILLTPVVTPISQDPADIGDPFEPLGRSFASRQARVRQVPYTQRNGITSTHLGFIKRGHVIILCFVVRPSQQIQLEFADITLAVSDDKPCIVVVCCSPVDTHQHLPFPTVIQTAGYSPAALEATAAAIFGEQPPPQCDGLSASVNLSERQPRLWPVEQWNEARDMSNVLGIWSECVSPRFSLDRRTLASLLRRPGYAKHYVVRDSRSEELLGFCATYLSYVDKEGEKLIASLAILLVRPTSRLQGVGLSLHSHAIGQLKRIRGVIRLQLGSTFPRILHGPPSDMHINEEWFRHRGWLLNKEIPGQGQVTHDLVLDFEMWRFPANLSLSEAIKFRLCTQGDMISVLRLVEKTSALQGKVGWFDQYSSLMNGPNVKDVVLGFESNDIVAAGLTYTPSCGSQIASNLPWAGRIGNDVGGVTCICISAKKPDTAIVGLLDACIQNLQSQGMKKMFIDGISNGLDEWVELGFQEWAKYRDVWKDA